MKNVRSMRVLSKDGRDWVVGEKSIRQSILLRNIQEETDIPEEGVHLLVDGEVLEKILEFFKEHERDEEFPKDYDPFDVLATDFDRMFLQVNEHLLFRITEAANYLHAPVLFELCCKTMANALKEKTTEEIREYLSLSKVESIEKEVQKEYKWIE